MPGPPPRVAVPCQPMTAVAEIPNRPAPYPEPMPWLGLAFLSLSTVNLTADRVRGVGWPIRPHTADKRN